MGLRFFARFRRSPRPGPARSGGWPGRWTGPWRRSVKRPVFAMGRHHAGRGPAASAAPRAPFPSPVGDTRARPARARRAERPPGGGHRAGEARAAVRPARAAMTAATAAAAATKVAPPRAATTAARLPWYEVAHARRAVASRRDCGPLERILHREWPEGGAPSPEAVRAIDRLAELPAVIADRLAAGLDAIYVGDGGVPELDDMGRLRGVPLPSGRATWDACAGAYGERKIIIGTRPSAAPDVVCHEVGHALDDLDGSLGVWQSDSDEFRALYLGCLPRMVSDFHRQTGSLGRREFFADAFAAITSGQRPALLDMLGGDTRSALDVMLYFNLRYGI